jgi:L-lactate utilization protein LutB
MNFGEVEALRKAFNSVKKRQKLNLPKDFTERKAMLKAIRKLCVGDEKLLVQTVEKLKKNGIKVHVAKEKDDAMAVILEEIGQEKLIVKSKSNVTKEIELTKTLEKEGISVIETDIGDRILQILGGKPSHPTGPIAHLSAKDIAKGLSEYYKISIKDDPEEIVKIVKEDIISNMEKAKIGITGANAITAEEGSIVTAHNEGNIYEVMRKEKHIVVSSIDKIYPDIESAINMLKVLSFNATGSIIPSFIEIITGVSKTADVEKKFIKGIHSPSDITLILVDNKRSELANTEFKELLYCVGCGNCLLSCPMYNTVGNDFARDSCLGGKGIAYYSQYNKVRDEKLGLCMTCGKCKQNCPMEINIPAIIRKTRSRGIFSEVYFFLKSHMIWAYYQILLRIKTWNKKYKLGLAIKDNS